MLTIKHIADANKDYLRCRDGMIAHCQPMPRMMIAVMNPSS